MTDPNQTTTLPDREVTTRLMATPNDTNVAGDIFGGWIMSQIDIAGAVAAHKRAGGRVVTVAVNSTVFHRPVFVGDMVSCYASIEKVGRTSLTVTVEVYAERERGSADCFKVTEATLTYVAVDEHRRPRPVSES
jgi:acyl-CoA thioesterase YciA